MTPIEKAIRDFCGHHADWWPSTTQVQEMLALAQPCPTCEALARTVMLDQTSHDQFKPDWDAMAVMVEKQQCMAKRILELEALAQPKQEPVKDLIASHNDICALLRQAHDALALTSYPPQRTWVDLTDDEMLMIYGQNHEGKKYNLGRMVQQALKEKNHDMG